MIEMSERPWGTYEVLLDAENCKVKRIIVTPGEELSYQYHHHRDEVWVIVEGKGEFTLDDTISKVEAGDYIKILRLQKHTIKNVSNKELIFIETQLGDSFEEEDIVRIKDKYGRVDG